MYAERLILKTDDSGKQKQIAVLPAHKQLEAIFLVIAETEQTNLCRKPHQDIAGKTRVLGNIIDTASVAEWHLPAGCIGYSHLAMVDKRRSTVDGFN